MQFQANTLGKWRHLLQPARLNYVTLNPVCLPKTTIYLLNISMYAASEVIYT